MKETEESRRGRIDNFAPPARRINPGHEKWQTGGKRRRNIGYAVAGKINARLHGEFARQ